MKSHRLLNFMRIFSTLAGVAATCAVMYVAWQQTPPPPVSPGADLTIRQIAIPGFPVWTILAGAACGIIVELVTLRIDEPIGRARIGSVAIATIIATLILIFFTFGNRPITIPDYGFRLLLNGIIYWPFATGAAILVTAIFESVKPPAVRRTIADALPPELRES